MTHSQTTAKSNVVARVKAKVLEFGARVAAPVQGFALMAA